MEPILSRCGFHCDMCLAYRPNVEAQPANQQKLSDGWYKYFGFRIPAAEILCDGCLAEHSEYIDQACPVRPCAIDKGLANCALCEQYICAKLAERLVVYEEIRKKINAVIPEDDYLCFIKPYENKARLDVIRANHKALIK